VVVHADNCKAADHAFGMEDCSCWKWSQPEPMPSYGKEETRLPRSFVAIQARINALKARRFKMKEYLLLKLEEEDFHGVQDAASDLRDIDAELKGLRWVVGDGE
jgi:hypothetical protein